MQPPATYRYRHVRGREEREGRGGSEGKEERRGSEGKEERKVRRRKGGGRGAGWALHARNPKK
jgi:hypothetical protein